MYTFSSQFSELMEDVSMVFARGSTIAANETIDGIYCVKQGFVKRFFIKNDGSISVQGIYGSGDCFGISALCNDLIEPNFYKGSEEYYYEAMSDDVQLQFISKDNLLAALSRDKSLYQDLFSILASHSLSDIWILENKGINNAYRQVAHILTFYATRYGKKQGNSRCIDVPFTQQDLADILGMSRETVSHSIAELKRSGFIKGRRTLTVQDINALKLEAYR